MTNVKHSATFRNTLKRTRHLKLFLPIVLLFLSVSTAFSKTPNSLLPNRIINHTVGVGSPYPTSSSMPNGYINPGAVVDVIGDFTIDNYCYITDVAIFVHEGKKISIEPTNGYDGSLLSLSNVQITSEDNSNTKLWKGIEVGHFCQLSTDWGTWIQNAEIAISSVNTSYASLSISNTIFYRNKIGINLEYSNPGGWWVVPPTLSYFSNNQFVGREESPALSQDIGLKIVNVPYSLAWNYGNTGNSFSTLSKGISIVGSYSVFDVNDYYFSNIFDTSIEFIDGESLSVTNNTHFFNPSKFAILFKNARNLNVSNSSFYSYPPISGLPFSLERRNIAVINPTTNSYINIQDNIFDVSGNFTKTGSTPSPTSLRCIDIGNSALPTTVLDYSVNIQNNTFRLLETYTSVFSTNTSDGIYLTGNNSSNSSGLIANNHFECNTTSSIYKDKWAIWSFGQRYNTQILSNVFLSGNATFLRFNGGGSGTGNVIKDNFCTQGANQNQLGTFIRVEESQNIKVCNNYDNARLVVSHYFIGNCVDMNLTSNTSYDNYNAVNTPPHDYPTLFLTTSPIIGTQIHKGNQWLTTSGNQPAINFSTFTNPNLVRLSKFTVHTTQSSNYFPTDIILPAQAPLSDFFETDVNGQPEVGCEPPMPLMGGTDQINDPLIAKNGLADYFSSPARQFDLKKHLYRKIKSNTAAYLDKNIYKEFMNKQESGNIGKSFDIEKNIFEGDNVDALIKANMASIKGRIKTLNEEKNKYDLKNKPSKDVIQENYKKRVQEQTDLENEYKKHDNNKKLKLKEAKRVIGNITPASTPEKLFKDVYQIYLDVQIEQNGQATAAQLQRLKEIAAMCPIDGGQIVLIARAFLSPKDLEDIKTDIARCESDGVQARQFTEGVSMQQQEKQQLRDQVIYPNPSQSTFSLNLKESESGILQMIDLMGTVVKSFTLKNGDNTIHHNLPSGVYIANLRTEKGKTTQKIIVRN